MVDAVHHHPRWGYYIRIIGEEDGAYDLIQLDGNDGNYELLPAVAA